MLFPTQRRVFLIGALSIALGLSQLAWGAPAESRIAEALAELETWLQPSPEGAGWRVYLQTEALQAQLARGEQADPHAVMAILGRFAADVPGLDAAPFVKVRNVLAGWLGTILAPSREELPQAVRQAKALFLRRTPSDLYEARLALHAAVERLESRLQAAGPEAERWRSYLHTELLKAQLARAEPDLRELEDIHTRFAAGYDSLGLVCFADVRRALRRYLLTARLMGDAALRKQYEAALDGLAGHLEAYAKTPTPDQAAGIARHLRWLDDTGQAPWLVAAVQRTLSHPNVFVTVSDRLVAARLSRSVDDVSPVEDCILGTRLYGTAHTRGQVRGVLVPCEEQALVDALFEGTSTTQNVGYNGPATIYSSGNTALAARKRFYLNAEGVFALPAVSTAITSTVIHQIDTGGRAVVERIAWKRAWRQKALAEAIASDHAQQRFNQRMDEQADDLVARANQGFQERFRQPLDERGLFPEYFRASTTPENVTLVLMTTGSTGLGAPTAPPELAAPADLAVRSHESSINNLAAAALSGVFLDEKRFDEITTRLLGFPQRKTEPADEENWAITFADEQPVTVRFAEGQLQITIRGKRYMNEGRQYEAMNVTARYLIEKTPQGFRAVRQGDLDISPPGFVPGAGRQLSARQIALRNALRRRFARFFEEIWEPENLVIGKDTPHPLELRLSRWETLSGWLVMTWEQVTPQKR